MKQSDRQVVAFRPSEEEQKFLQAIQKKTGLPMTKILGVGLRQYAESLGIPVGDQGERLDVSTVPNAAG